MEEYLNYRLGSHVKKWGIINMRNIKYIIFMVLIIISIPSKAYAISSAGDSTIPMIMPYGIDYKNSVDTGDGTELNSTNTNKIDIGNTDITGGVDTNSGENAEELDTGNSNNTNPDNEDDIDDPTETPGTDEDTISPTETPGTDEGAISPTATPETESPTDIPDTDSGINLPTKDPVVNNPDLPEDTSGSGAVTNKPDITETTNSLNNGTNYPADQNQDNNEENQVGNATTGSDNNAINGDIIVKNTGFDLAITFTALGVFGIMILVGIIVTVGNDYFAQNDE